MSARILQNATGFNPVNRRALADAGIIPDLLEVTGAGDSVAAAAVGALSNLFHADQKNKLLGVDEDAATVLSKLLQSGTPTVAENCARALSNFVVGCVPAARAAVAAGAVSSLLQAVKYLKQNVMIVSVSVRALGNLAAISQTFRDHLRDDGVPSAVSSLLSWCVADEHRAENKMVQVLTETVCACIANLARDSPAQRRVFERCIGMLCQLLAQRSTSRASTEQALRALWCLLVDTPKNRITAADNGLFSVLAALLSDPARADSSIKTLACNAARHAVLDSQAGQAAALHSGLVVSIVKCIGGTTPPALWRAALAALLDLGAGYPAAWRAMRDAGLNTLWLPASDVLEDEPSLESGDMPSTGPPGMAVLAQEASQALSLPSHSMSEGLLEESLDFSASLASMQNTMGLTSTEPAQPHTSIAEGAAGMMRVTRVPAPHLRPGLHFGNVEPESAAQPVAETQQEDFFKPIQRQLAASTETKWPELERVADHDAPFHPKASTATRKLMEQAGMSFYSPQASSLSDDAALGGSPQGRAGPAAGAGELLDGDSVVLRGPMAMLGGLSNSQGKTNTNTQLDTSPERVPKPQPGSIFHHETAGPKHFPPPQEHEKELRQTAMRRTSKAPQTSQTDKTSIPASSIGSKVSALVTGGSAVVDSRWSRSIDNYRVPGAGVNTRSPTAHPATADLFITSVFSPGAIVDLDTLLDDPEPDRRVGTGLSTASVDAAVFEFMGGTTAVGKQCDIRRQEEVYALLHPPSAKYAAIDGSYKNKGRLQARDPSSAMHWTASREASRQLAEEAAHMLKSGNAQTLGYQPYASTGSAIRDELDLFFALASDDGVRQRELRQRNAT